MFDIKAYDKSRPDVNKVSEFNLESCARYVHLQSFVHVLLDAEK